MPFVSSNLKGVFGMISRRGDPRVQMTAGWALARAALAGAFAVTATLGLLASSALAATAPPNDHLCAAPA